MALVLSACKKDREPPPVHEYWVGWADAALLRCFTVTEDGTWFAGYQGSIKRTQLTPHPDYYYINSKSLYFRDDNRIDVSEMVEAPGSKLLYVSDLDRRYSNSDLFLTDSTFKQHSKLSDNIWGSFPYKGGPSFRQFRCLAADRKGNVYFSVYGEAPSGYHLKSYIGVYTGDAFSYKFYTSPLMDRQRIWKLRADPAGFLYAVMEEGQLLAAAAPYDNWKKINPQQGAVIDVAPGANGELYVSSENGISRSPDYGASFTNLSMPTGVTGHNFERIYINDKGSLYGMCDSNAVERRDSTSNCFYTTDKGATWHNLEPGNRTPYLVLQGFSHSGRLLATAPTPEYFISARLRLPDVVRTGEIISSHIYVNDLFS